ncbi:hypothetical protein Pyn_34016 [Prunus yedoensis var. nudiflora]|uniref:Uncharacterized protein n=1 Tax=Prunus yedoensis var. nudiflora TaxID=2094558 RepID=A0A314ULT3_PRUYE|nr:hypothetical protein Pyn_34016 [Prunus yedoensis var. nudiflora]
MRTAQDPRIDQLMATRREVKNERLGGVKHGRSVQVSVIAQLSKVFKGSSEVDLEGRCKRRTLLVRVVCKTLDTLHRRHHGLMSWTMTREGVTSVHKDKTSVAGRMSKGISGSLREALADWLGSLDNTCGKSAQRTHAA